LLLYTFDSQNLFPILHSIYNYDFFTRPL
jgi:hypothetical protein